MKTSRFLFVTLPFTTALALAQTVVDTSVPPRQEPTHPPAPELLDPPPVLTPIGAETLPASTGETTLTLDVGFGIRPVPASRVTVPAGETLRIIAPNLGEGIQYIWTKNGQAIEGAPSENALVINHVTSADAGEYVCLFSSPTTLPKPSQALILGVGPNNRLLNISTRGRINGDESLISGFVVAASAQPKKLILRAIGPSLAQFGVSDPLAAPVLQVLDSKGKPYNNGYVYPAVVGGPTYESDLAESLAKTGAFPLPPGTRDVVLMMPFVPGSYTAQVTSGDGTAGTVLLEIYEVP